jgi:sugar (pentulose or hexulose) kinase
LGAAAMAAAGNGYFADMWAASAAMVHIARRLTPDPSARDHYEHLYREVYLPLYPRVKELFKVL